MRAPPRFPRRPVRACAVAGMSASVTRTSISAASAEAHEVLASDLARVGDRDHPIGGGDHRALGGGLSGIGSGQPVPSRGRVGTEKRDVEPQFAEQPQGLGADGSLGNSRTRPPSRCNRTPANPVSRAATGRRVDYGARSMSIGHGRGHPHGGRAHIERRAVAGARQVPLREFGDAVVLRGAGAVALGGARF